MSADNDDNERPCSASALSPARGRALCLYARAALAQGSRRRGLIRRFLARALQHRCLDLSDRAGGRGRATERGCGARGAQIAVEEGVHPAARSRDVPVRADRRRGTGHRPLEVPQQRRRARRADTRSRRAARHCPRPAQRAAEASWPVVSRRCVHFGAGHHRRDGRQQLLRLALDPLREYGAQRPRDRSMAAERRHLLVRAQR